MRSRWLALGGGVLVLVLGPSVLPAAPPAPPRRPAISGREVIERFAANLDSFPHYTCRYTVTRAEAKSFGDALAGKWVNAVSCDYRLLVDGGKQRWSARRVPPPPGGAAAGRPGSVAPSGLQYFSDFDYLCNGEIGISDAARAGPGAWELYDLSFPFWPPDPVPLCVGHGPIWSPRYGPDALFADPEAVTFSDEGLREMGGRQVRLLRFVKLFNPPRGRSETLVSCFHLDPARGYLPVYYSLDSATRPSPSGHPCSQTYLLRAWDCGDGRWFPEQTLSVQAPVRSGRPFLVTEMRLTELDVDGRPSATAFRVTIPAGSEVSYPNAFSQRLRLVVETTVTPDDLPALFAQWEQSGPPPGRFERLLHAAIPFLPWLGAGILFLAASAAFVWWLAGKRVPGGPSGEAGRDDGEGPRHA